MPSHLRFACILSQAVQHSVHVHACDKPLSNSRQCAWEAGRPQQQCHAAGQVPVSTAGGCVGVAAANWSGGDKKRALKAMPCPSANAVGTAHCGTDAAVPRLHECRPMCVCDVGQQAGPHIAALGSRQTESSRGKKGVWGLPWKAPGVQQAPCRSGARHQAPSAPPAVSAPPPHLRVPCRPAAPEWTVHPGALRLRIEHQQRRAGSSLVLHSEFRITAGDQAKQTSLRGGAPCRGGGEASPGRSSRLKHSFLPCISRIPGGVRLL